MNQKVKSESFSRHKSMIQLSLVRKYSFPNLSFDFDLVEMSYEIKIYETLLPSLVIKLIEGVVLFTILKQLIVG